MPLALVFPGGVADGEKVMVETAVPTITEGLVQPLRDVIIGGGRQAQTGRAAVLGKMPRSAHQQASDAAATIPGIDEQIMEYPDRVRIDRVEAGIELYESCWPPVYLGQIDGGFPAPLPVMQECPRGVQIRAPAIETPIGIEQRGDAIDVR